jgi:hypothetical protein
MKVLRADRFGAFGLLLGFMSVSSRRAFSGSMGSSGAGGIVRFRQAGEFAAF